MKPTNSSVKKSKKNSMMNSLRDKPLSQQTNVNSVLKTLSQHPYALLILFKNLKSYHTQVMLESPHNRTLKMIYFVFSPYIIAMCIIMKNFMNFIKKYQAVAKKNLKIQVNKEKFKKEAKVDTMLVQLKNQELQEEKAKNAELKRHIEILKKRVYAKMEFEGQTKNIKEASQMIDNIKVLYL